MPSIILKNKKQFDIITKLAIIWKAIFITLFKKREKVDGSKLIRHERLHKKYLISKKFIKSKRHF